jgi:hypothetical protein
VGFAGLGEQSLSAVGAERSIAVALITKINEAVWDAELNSPVRHEQAMLQLQLQAKEGEIPGQKSVYWKYPTHLLLILPHLCHCDIPEEERVHQPNDKEM